MIDVEGKRGGVDVSERRAGMMVERPRA